MRNEYKYAFIPPTGPNRTLGIIPDGENCIVIELSGNRSMNFGCTAETLWEGVTSWITGESVQDAFPFLDASEREFLLTGLFPEEWDTLIPKDEE